MNILFDINHPGHVHFFKNAIKILKSRGHGVTITARDKEVTSQLLKNYNLKFHLLSKAQKGLSGLAMELLIRQAKLLPILIKEKIDLCASITGACSVHIAKILGIPSLVFYDTEHATLQNSITVPFATHYITPDCYQHPPRKNQITYAGVHELAYMHPKYFTPDPSIYDYLKIGRQEKFVVMRFVAWGASHDIGQKGLSLTLKRELIKALSPLTKVFIVSEAPLDAEFEPYRMPIPPHRVHDALAFATLFIGEGATMASECACVGTPAIYINSLKLGYITMEEKKYGLVLDLMDEDIILAKALEIVRASDRGRWQAKKESFLKEKIDVTEFIVNTILKFEKKK